MTPLVIYKTKYGATEQYARWLAEALGCEALPADRLRPGRLDGYDTLLFGGGIYASGILGISQLKKHWRQAQGKRIFVFAVGASPYDPSSVEEIKKRNLTGALGGLSLFYLRGAWDESKMTWPDKTMCAMLKKALSKKSAADCAPWELALLEAAGASPGMRLDWTDREALGPLLEQVRRGI